jgi:uncharacterized protein YggT (Ycf19 family)
MARTQEAAQFGAPQSNNPQSHETKIGLLRASKVVVVFVYIVVMVNLVLLALGFCLQLFGASTDAEFTRWVYRAVERIMQPFRGMFPSRALSDQSVFDASLLFAMVVYAIVGIGLHALISWLTEKIVTLRRREQVAQRRVRPGGPISSPVGPPEAPVGVAQPAHLPDPSYPPDQSYPSDPRARF